MAGKADVYVLPYFSVPFALRQNIPEDTGNLHRMVPCLSGFAPGLSIQAYAFKPGQLTVLFTEIQIEPRDFPQLVLRAFDPFQVIIQHAPHQQSLFVDYAEQQAFLALVVLVNIGLGYT